MFININKTCINSNPSKKLKFQKMQAPKNPKRLHKNPILCKITSQAPLYASAENEAPKFSALVVKLVHVGSVPNQEHRKAPMPINKSSPIRYLTLIVIYLNSFHDIPIPANPKTHIIQIGNIPILAITTPAIIIAPSDNSKFLDLV